MSDQSDSAGSGPAANPSGDATEQSDYQILHLIGRGAYGEVFLAKDRQGKYRAVKVIFRESFDHDRPFEREYEGIRRFEIISRSYPDQIQIFAVGRRQEPQQFYYIMELADDQEHGRDIQPDTYVPKTLRSELKRLGRLAAADCITLGLKLAGTMQSLHENSLIHRDIKPANIIFVNGQPKLADIGLVTDAERSVSHVGTEGFIPPEGPGSVQADIYSLGKVLYEMSTGRDRMDFPELPANFAELPDREVLLEINAVVAKACEPDSQKRYRNAGELIDDLRYLQAGKSVRYRRITRYRLFALAMTGLLTAVCGLLAWGTHKLWRMLAAHPVPAQPQNLVVNGSFEWPEGPFSGKGLPPNILNSAYLEPWKTTAANFEIWRDGTVMTNLYDFKSADGLQNLEILSTTNVATVWQTVSTVPGAKYSFSFYHTPRPRVMSRLTVSINDTVIETFDEDGMNLTSFRWQKFTTNFVTTATQTTLSFADEAADERGTHIDGVVLTPVPATTDGK